MNSRATLAPAVIICILTLAGCSSTFPHVWEGVMKAPNAKPLVIKLNQDTWSPDLDGLKIGETTLGEVLARKITASTQELSLSEMYGNSLQWLKGYNVYTLNILYTFRSLKQTPFSRATLFFMAKDDGRKRPFPDGGNKMTDIRKEAVLQMYHFYYTHGVPSARALKTLGKPLKVVQYQNRNEWWLFKNIFIRRHTKFDQTIDQLFFGVQPFVDNYARQQMGTYYVMSRRSSGPPTTGGASEKKTPNACSSWLPCPYKCVCRYGRCEPAKNSSGQPITSASTCGY